MEYIKQPIPRDDTPLGSALDQRANQSLFGRLVHEINQKLNSGVDYEQILDFLFDSLGMLIPYDRIGVAIVNEARDRIGLTWVRSKIPVKHLPRNYSAKLEGSSLERVLNSGEPRIISDLQTYLAKHPKSESTRLILEDGIRSNLTCPLRSENKFFGVVFFSSCTPNTYRADHIDTFCAISEELSVIIEHGRLQNYFSRNLSKTLTLKMILHDIRSPLGIIQGFLQEILEEEWYRNLSQPERQTIEILQRNANVMRHLIDNLGELLKYDINSNNLEEDTVVLSEFLPEMASHGKSIAEHKGISFQANFERELPHLAVFDHQKIRRVLDNLISNAVKYSDRGTVVTLRVVIEDGRLVFAVSDQGQGIPDSESAKVFVGKTSVRPTEGETSTGLGLIIAKKIVEQHGGQISFRSRVGEGSTFQFWIPLKSDRMVN